MKAYATGGLRAAIVLVALSLAGPPAAAQSGPTTRVRGTVERLEGTTLVVASREGKAVTIRLGEGWSASGVKAAALSEIKAGDFVGTAAVPGTDGRLRALEVLIFPAGVKSNEGHGAWDLLPESTMTNATVADTVQGVNGRTLDLAYAGGKQSVEVPADVPVVTFAPAERTDVRPGAPVFVPAQRGADGSLSASRVIVGNNGIAPPM